MIDAFNGEYRFLSNFYPAPVEFLHFLFPTVEHAFQAAKFAHNKEIFNLFLDPKLTPGDTKRLARKHKALMEQTWHIYGKDLVMFFLLRQKFAAGTDLAAKLMETGDTPLIEGNTWGDTYWGVCNGVGDNVLGNILMLIRSDLLASA